MLEIVWFSPNRISIVYHNKYNVHFIIHYKHICVIISFIMSASIKKKEG